MRITLWDIQLFHCITKKSDQSWKDLWMGRGRGQIYHLRSINSKVRRLYRQGLGSFPWRTKIKQAPHTCRPRGQWIRKTSELSLPQDPVYRKTVCDRRNTVTWLSRPAVCVQMMKVIHIWNDWPSFFHSSYVEQTLPQSLRLMCFWRRVCVCVLFAFTWEIHVSHCLLGIKFEKKKAEHPWQSPVSVFPDELFRAGRPCYAASG